MLAAVAAAAEDGSDSGGLARQTRPSRQCLKYQRSPPLLDFAYQRWVAAILAAVDSHLRLVENPPVLAVAAAAYTIVAVAAVEAYHCVDDPFRLLLLEDWNTERE